MSERQRLFLALWPPEAVRAALASVQRRWLAEGAAGRVVPEARLHLTLVFLGALDQDARRALEAACDSLAWAPFRLRLDRLGYWPRAQVAWMGSGHVPPALAALVDALREAAEAVGRAPERRPFVPHVTLLRGVRRRPPSLETGPIDWSVTAFVLAVSQLSPAGAHYRILRRWPANLPPQDSF